MFKLLRDKLANLSSSLLVKRVAVLFSIAVILSFLLSLYPYLHSLVILLIILISLSLAIYTSHRHNTSIPFLDLFLKRSYYKTKFRLNALQNELAKPKRPLPAKFKNIPTLFNFSQRFPKLCLLLLALAYLKILYFAALLFKSSEDSFEIIKEELQAIHGHKLSIMDEEKKELITITKVRERLERGEKVDINILQKLYLKLFELHKKIRKRASVFSLSALSAIIFATIASGLITSIIFPAFNTKAATSTWTQTDWTALSSNTAIDPTNQSGWIEYSAADANISTSSEANIVAAWHMDGDWNDAEGSNNGTALNSVPTFSSPGKVGSGAGSFDGEDDRVSVGNFPTQTAISIEAWLKVIPRTMAQCGGAQNIFTKYADTTNRAFIFEIRASDDSYSNQIELIIYKSPPGAGDNHHIIGTTEVTDNQWHHVVAIWSGATDVMKIYIDGVEETLAYNTGSATAMRDITADTVIGGFAGGSGYLSGLLDEVAVYNTALSADAVTNHYNSGQGKYVFSQGKLALSQASASVIHTSDADFSGTTSSTTVASNSVKLAADITYQTKVAATDGLVSYWKMDNDWNDSKGTNNLTPVGDATFGTAKYGTYSGSFDGAGDYAKKESGVSGIGGTNQLSVEAWVKRNGIGTNQAIVGQGNNSDWYGNQFYIDVDNYINIDLLNIINIRTLVKSTNAFTDTLSWHHIAFTYNAGTVKLYLDGQEAATTVTSNTLIGAVWVTSEYLGIGNMYSTSIGWGMPFNGLIDEAAIYNTALSAATIADHSAAYVSSGTYESATIDLGQKVNFGNLDFTKTAAVDDNTKLLLHYNDIDGSTTFTDSGVTGHTVTANGNTQIDIAQSKFGGASALFDGSGDSLTAPAHADFDFSSSNFTIDGWVKFASVTATEQVIFSNRAATDQADKGFGLVFNYSANNKMGLWLSSNGSSWNIAYENYGTKTDWNANQWYHIAFTWDGSTYRVFIDGVLDMSVTSSAGLYPSGVALGAWMYGGWHLNGWIDEFKVSKGIARWTADFTPSTSAYGEVEFQLAANNDDFTWDYVGPDGTASTYYTSTSTAISSSLNGNRYVRYKAYLSADGLQSTPTLDDVTLNYSYYPASATLTSSAYNTTVSTNIINSLTWTENLPAGTDVKFQLRTSANGSSWTDWLGPTANSDYYTAPAGTETTNSAHSDRLSDQWTQYKVYLTSDGRNTPTLSDVTLTYGNARPEVQSVAASQGANGAVTVTYDIRDRNTTTGVTPNVLNITLQYCTGGCSTPGSETWADAVTVTGDTSSSVAVAEDNFTSKTLYWTATADYNEYNNTDFKVRIKANDSETMANLAYGESAIFTIDTAPPALSAIPIKVQANDNNPATVILSATDDSAPLQYKLSLNADLAGATWQNYTVADYQSIISATPGLVSYWKMDNNWNDSKSINHGTAQGGATFGTAKYGTYSGSFDGTNDYVNIGDPVDGSLDFTTNITLEAWIKETGSNSSGAGIVTKHDIGWNGYGLNFTDPNKIIFFVDWGWDGKEASAILVNDGQWHHVVGTYNGTIIRIFVDGVEGTPYSYSNPIPLNSNNFVIGYGGGNSYFFNGLVDEVAVYNTAISAQTIAEHYNGYLSTTLNLVTDPDTVYAQFKDAYGNTTAIQSATTPETPANMIFRDLSNPPESIYQEFISWKVATEPDPGFAKYNIWRSTDGANYSISTTIATRATNYLFDTSLASTTTYYYKITTEDTNGNISYFSSGVNDKPDGQGGTDTTPPTITSVSATTTTQTATITWTTDELSNSTVGYSATPATFTTEIGVASYVTSHSVTLTGLTPGETYYYRVISEDPTGNQTIKSNNYSFTTVAGPAISAVSASDVKNTEAVITWNTNIASDSYVYYSTHADLSGATQIPGATSTTAHSVTITPLTSGAKYYFYVKSGVATDKNVINGVINYYNFTTTSDTSAPTILGITATSITDTTAVIEWTTNERATEQVEYGAASSAYTASTTLNSTLNLNHAVALTDLTQNTTYYFHVISTDGSNNTSTSSQASFATRETLSTETQVRQRETTAQASGETIGRSSVSGGGVFTSKTDKIPPTISDVKVSAIKSDQAIISWKTDEEGYSVVEFGADTTYGVMNGKLDQKSTTHSVTLKNLMPSTAYQYRVLSGDVSGNLAMGSNQAFTTLSVLEEEAGPSAGQGEGEEGGSKENIIKETARKAMDIIGQYAGDVSLSVLESTLFAQYSSLEKIAEIFPSPIFSSGPEVVTTPTTASINWETNKEANSLIAFAPDNIYAVSANRDNPYIQLIGNPEAKTTNHAVTLYDLKSNTVYHYQLRSKSPLGPTGMSRDFTFRTAEEALEIISHAVENVSNEKAVFRWATNQETDTAIKYIPYRNNVLAVDEVRAKTDNTLTTIHEMSLDDLEAGVVYQIELIGKDIKGALVTREIPTFTTSSDDLPPLIYQVQAESAISPGKESKIQTIISWLTNEPSTSRVWFQKGFAGTTTELIEKTALDINYTKKHVAVITKFEPGSIYTFRVESTDSGGNTTTSKTYTILAPKQKETVFQVIMKNLEQTFSWVKGMGL